MKYYGQFSVPVDEFIYERYFKSKRFKNNGFFIECGAFDGVTECSCKFFEETLGWKGINVEPSPVIYSRLIANRPHSYNVNVALSNENTTGTFHSVVHPIFGEQCTNGSLEHTVKHLKALKEIGCEFKKYEVKIIRYPDLIKQFHVNHVDLFVLDVEGQELKVIDSMRGCDILPDIFCVEHGQLNEEEVIRSVEALGYEYDTRSYVNSYFVKKEKGFRNWWRNWRAKMERDEKFFALAKTTEMYILEGRALDESMVRNFRENSTAFAAVSADVREGKVCVFSVCGVEGKSCEGQTVYYYLRGDKGDHALLRTIPQERPDYAEFRKSELYRMSGSRVLIDRSFLESKHYDVWILLEQSGNKYLVKNNSIDL